MRSASTDNRRDRDPDSAYQSQALCNGVRPLGAPPTAGPAVHRPPAGATAGGKNEARACVIANSCYVRLLLSPMRTGKPLRTPCRHQSEVLLHEAYGKWGPGEEGGVKRWSSPKHRTQPLLASGKAKLTLDDVDGSHPPLQLLQGGISRCICRSRHRRLKRGLDGGVNNCPAFCTQCEVR